MNYDHSERAGIYVSLTPLAVVSSVEILQSRIFMLQTSLFFGFLPKKENQSLLRLQLAIHCSPIQFFRFT